MTTTETNEYAYDATESPWDHGIIMPPILRAARGLPAGGRVLDVGCGNGALLRELKVEFPHLLMMGVESSKSAVAMAIKNGIAARLADACDDLGAALDHQLFDLVITAEVIEHVTQPRQFLRRIREVTAVGGKLVVTTPYHGYLKNLAIALAGKCDGHYNPLWDGGHIKFWSRKTLTDALREAGFGNPQFYGAGRFPFLWQSMVMTVRAY